MKYKHLLALFAFLSRGICLISTGTALGADPPGYTAATRWPLNDGTTTPTVQDYSSGFNRVVTPNLNTSTIDAVRTATDTPHDPEAGVAIKFVGQEQGGETKSSIIAPTASTNTGAFFVASTPSASNAPSYEYCEGSRTISAWFKLEGSTTTPPLPPGVPATIFYHGRPPANPNGDRTCKLETSLQSTDPGAVTEPTSCRGFALGVYRPSSVTQAFLTFGNTNGDFSLGTAVLLDTTQNPNCHIDMHSDTNLNLWHHVMGVFSEDLMHQAANSVLIYLDGNFCGGGKIAHPYTDVGDDSLWRIGTHVDILNPGTTLTNNKPFPGFVDDVRVYSQALGPAAVNWLYNNSGRASN